MRRPGPRAIFRPGQRSVGTRRLLGLGLAAGLAVGCAPDEPVRVTPSILYFDAAHPSRTLTLRNAGASEVALARVRLDTRTPDWGSFVLTDAALPRSVPAGGEVELHLRADTKHFVSEHAHGEPPHYRRGRSRLLLQADGARAIELRFEPPPTPGLALQLGRLGTLAAALALLVALRRRRPASAPVPWALLVAVAILPWGPPLCVDQVGARLGRAALEQCALGHGGAPLVLAPTELGVGLGLALLLLVDLARWGAAARDSAPASALRSGARSLLADLALLLAIAPALAGADVLAVDALALAQEDAWGVIRHPIAALLALAAAALRGSAASRVGADDLGIAALLTLVFFGGWTPPPGLPFTALPHGLMLALGVVLTLGKSAAIALGIAALRRRLPATLAARALGPLLTLALLTLVVTALVRS